MDPLRPPDLLPAPVDAQSRAAFLEPWLPRPVNVDDATLDSLLRTLVQQRRFKFVLAGLAAVGGAFSFGLLSTGNVLYDVLMHLTLALTFGFPTLGIGSICVRQLFLAEAKRNGLSRTAAMLVLTRAERKARHKNPFAPTDALCDELADTVRAWDEA